MKKLQTPKLTKIKKIIPSKLRRRGSAAINENPLRITNETVAEHREKVLASARKFKYPLQQSKHKIVVISLSLFVTALIVFFVYCATTLYHYKSSSDFLYGVTRVVPFPIAKAEGRYVAYENYLFELRRYVHFYKTQQKLDFNTSAGRLQLADYKKKALSKAIDDAYVKVLATKNGVSVSTKELNDEVAIFKSQNRFGASDKGFEDVLQENFGWDLNDFRRELAQQLLAQKVVDHLDTEAHAKANAAYAELTAGGDFAAIAKKYSEDVSTKDNGGDYGVLVDKTNRDISAKVTDELFRLKPSEVSGIISSGYSLNVSGYSLEIVKNIEPSGDKIHAAHITIKLKSINDYVKDARDRNKPTSYVNF